MVLRTIWLSWKVNYKISEKKFPVKKKQWKAGESKRHTDKTIRSYYAISGVPEIKEKAKVAEIPYFAIYNVFLYIMHTHVFGPNFQGKNLLF